MTTDIEIFSDSLRMQLECYKRLLAMAGQEKEFLVSRNVAKINDILRQKEAILSEINQYENTRRACCQRMSVLFKNRSLRLTIAEVTKIAGQPYSDSLAQTTRELKDTIGKIKIANNQNTVLINRLLSYANDTMKIFMAFTSRNGLYQDNGSMFEYSNNRLYDKRI